jgi:uncharacterized membrane protein (UPF0127 family)
MAKTGRMIHKQRGDTLLEQVRWCESFGCKLRGLMFRRELAPGEGLLMVEPRESRTATAIHMLFMNFAIASIWLDDSCRVVDSVLARPWRLAYAPSKPARYTLECAPAILERVEVGDELVFVADET